jgi:hypothetical protein
LGKKKRDRERVKELPDRKPWMEHELNYMATDEPWETRRH